MAINYTEVGWDTTKYVNPTNMNQMDDGIKAACDGVDALDTEMGTTSISSIGDGTVTGAISSIKNTMPTSANYLDRGEWWDANNGQNIDDITSGVHFVYTSHGAPIGGTLITFSGADIGGASSNYRWQMIFDYYIGSLLYVRSRNGDNAAWNAWHRVALTSDLPEYSITTGTGITLERYGKVRVMAFFSALYSDAKSFYSSLPDSDKPSTNVIASVTRMQSVDVRGGSLAYVYLAGSSALYGYYFADYSNAPESIMQDENRIFGSITYIVP